MYSKFVLIGNLGNSPEMRYLPNGTPVASFSLAVNKVWIGEGGEKKEKTTWYRVTTWRKLAETVSQYLTKGQRVLVEGEDVEARAYTNKSGEAACSLEITASTIKFMSAKGEVQSNENGQSSQQPTTTTIPDESDIPF